MKKDMPDIKITAFNDLFSTEEDRQAEKHGAIVNISITEIDDFHNHPFKVEENADMRTLKNSITENGVISPCIVRQKENGRYEMISGHRRKFASTLAGLSELPCIIKNLNDEEATVLMVDSNSYREYILPSEKAFAYKMKLEALKKPQGFRSDLKASGRHGKTSKEILAKDTGESTEQIRRYVCLTRLIPEILKFVDNSVHKDRGQGMLSISLRPAVELSYLTEKNQKIVLEYILLNMITPSHAQAIQLRALQASDNFSPDTVHKILSQAKPNQIKDKRISTTRFKPFFSDNISLRKMEEEIITALKFYRQHNKI